MQKRQGSSVVGNTQADGFALGVKRAIGYFFGCLQDKGVAAGRSCFKLAELGIIYFGVSTQFAQIGTHQGQMVFLIDFTNRENALHRVFVTEFATQRITGIRRVNDDTATTDNIGGLLDEAVLGIIGMDGEKLCHVFFLIILMVCCLTF